MFTFRSNSLRTRDKEYVRSTSPNSRKPKRSTISLSPSANKNMGEAIAKPIRAAGSLAEPSGIHFPSLAWRSAASASGAAKTLRISCVSGFSARGALSKNKVLSPVSGSSLAGVRTSSSRGAKRISLPFSSFPSRNRSLVSSKPLTNPCANSSTRCT